jgi:hypothetical protein
MIEVDVSFLSNVSPRVSRRRGTVGALVVLMSVLAAAFPSAASPVRSASADAAASWMATQVAPDGSVLNPYDATPSVDWAVNVALGLVVTGNETAAMNRLMSYIRTNVTTYTSSGTSDPVGHLSWLVLLAKATGDNPRAFGTPSVDLIAAIDARYEVEEASVYGSIDPYTPVTNQSLAILALHSAGAPVPTAAVEWLKSQQCDSPVVSAGAWQGYRSSLGGLAPCLSSSSSEYESPEVGSTSIALQALGAIGETGSFPTASAWIQTLQSPGSPGAGGFGQWIGDPADPNSTAVAIQAIVATGGDPAALPWSSGGSSPMTSLESWIIASGDEAGAFASPYSSGYADLFATFQGVWGLTLAALPFTEPNPDPTPPTTIVPAADQPVLPSFTG